MNYYHENQIICCIYFRFDQKETCAIQIICMHKRKEVIGPEIEPGAMSNTFFSKVRISK